MAQLIEWNNIKNNFVYPGQKLTIKGGTAGGSSTTNSGNNTASAGSSSAGTTTNNSSGTRYTVKAGDSVWGISNAHGISMAQLIQWNNIKNNFVYPGQSLIVSNGGSASVNTPSTPSTPSTGASVSGAKYTVKAGDSVWGVSHAHGISMAQLIQWNNIKNNFIYPGQQLVVSNGGASSTVSTQVQHLQQRRIIQRLQTQQAKDQAPTRSKQVNRCGASQIKMGSR